MKKIYIITNIKNCGPYRVLESMINYSKSKDKNISIISVFGKDDAKIIEDLKNKGINVYSLNLNKFSFVINGRKKLKNILCILKGDVVHSHGILPDYLLSKVRNYKKVTTLHNNMYEDYIFSFGKFFGKFLIMIHKKQLEKFDSVVCCSKSIYYFLKNKYKNKNLTYVVNGIDYLSEKQIVSAKLKNKIRKEFNISNQDRLFIYIGVLSEGKNIVELIKMFNETGKNNKLLVLGNGEKYEECKLLANDNIYMLGYIKDVFPYLIASDVYISNSLSEGFSISVLEALMCNKTLFLSDIPSHKEVVNMSSEYCGTIFNSKDFLKKINDLKLAKKFSDEFLYLISSERMVDEYEKIYKQL